MYQVVSVFVSNCYVNDSAMILCVLEGGAVAHIFYLEVQLCQQLCYQVTSLVIFLTVPLDMVTIAV